MTLKAQKLALQREYASLDEDRQTPAVVAAKAELAARIAEVDRQIDATIDLWNRPVPDPDYARVQALREAVFNKIAPEGNWKNPIDAVIDESDLRQCVRAAEFFAGSTLSVAARLPGSKVRVTGPGYYASVGA